MKHLTLIIIILSNFAVLAQSKEKQKNIMNDSLGQAVNNFCIVVQNYLCKNIATQKDVDDFLNYVYTHADDTLQSSESIFPYDVPKDTMIAFLRRQTKDMIGEKCKFEFKFWDGWDGKTNFVGFGFNILYHHRRNKFLMIVDSYDKIHCIFSMASL